MYGKLFCLVLLLPFFINVSAAATTSPVRRGIDYTADEFVEISAETLEDKIRGGLLAQLLGNLNGLAHENKYYDEPGNVQQYTPGLPEGARTDDDTDIEWVYIAAMQRGRTVRLGA